MPLSFPHMGNIWVPLMATFRELGIDARPAPPTTKRTLSLGTKYSPETICLPFKITLGNMIEALEQGADAILMAAGRGLCRFGYYYKIQEQILEEMGYKFEMITPNDLFKDKILGVFKMIKQRSKGASTLKVISAIRFGLSKLGPLDEVERLVHKVRAVELNKGTATRLFKEAIAAIDLASDHASLKRAKKEYIAKLMDVPVDPKADPIVVGITGEFYVILEPFTNMDVEIELGKLGVEVRRSLYLSEWTKFSLFLNAFGLSEKEKSHRAAMPYLCRDVGGDGWETVGEKVMYANKYDGLVHLAPFTCMPEIIAQNIMPSTKEKIPVLTLICDEQMGRTGMLTRLEAFVDLLQRRRRQKAFAKA